MIIKEIGIKETTKFFLQDPKLCVLGLSDTQLYFLDKDKKYHVEPGEYLYGLYEKEQLIAVVTFAGWDTDVLNMHFYLGTTNYNRDVIKRFYPVVEEILIKDFNHNKVMVRVPNSCQHVQQVVQAIGFKFTETIKDGIEWRGIVEDLDIYETKINRENT